MDRRVQATLIAKVNAYVECGKLNLATDYLAALLADLRGEGVDTEYAFRLSESIEPGKGSSWLVA